MVPFGSPTSDFRPKSVTALRQEYGGDFTATPYWRVALRGVDGDLVVGFVAVLNRMIVIF